MPEEEAQEYCDQCVAFGQKLNDHRLELKIDEQQ